MRIAESASAADFNWTVLGNSDPFINYTVSVTAANALSHHEDSLSSLSPLAADPTANSQTSPISR